MMLPLYLKLFLHLTQKKEGNLEEEKSLAQQLDKTKEDLIKTKNGK